MTAINRGFFISAVVSAVLVAIAAFIYLPSSSRLRAQLDAARRHRDAGRATRASIAIVAVLIGIVLAAVIQQLTGYFTETDRKPVQDIGRRPRSPARPP